MNYLLDSNMLIYHLNKALSPAAKQAMEQAMQMERRFRGAPLPILRPLLPGGREHGNAQSKVG